VTGLSTESFKIDKLIINNPYEMPKEYWERVPSTTQYFRRKQGRRQAGYIKASESEDPDAVGTFIPIPLVNKIRERVDQWRDNDYPGTTGITRRLLQFWNDNSERNYPFFFCQMEAIETIIWLTEAPESSKEGIEIPNDGGPFTRLCSKMATGTGKTTVMAMLIAWHILNKVTYPDDPRFSKNVFILTPNLTIKNRLQVLFPDSPNNYYAEFGVVPYDLKDKLRQGKVRVTNWHILSWENQEQLDKKRSVVKLPPKSDKAYTKEILGDMAKEDNILVINDEAHHAWRKPPESKIKMYKDEEQMATIWVNGLDRIHRTQGILICHDFTATPFAPTGRTSPEDTLFTWIISDFNLNDAIESGLTKTPRIVFRDDASPDKKLRSKLYHIYRQDEVRGDLNRRAKPEEPLPDLVIQAYTLLGADWVATYEEWKKQNFPTPPVMITVANRTETAARIKYSFDNNYFRIDELSNPETTLHIDSKIIKADEKGIEMTLQAAFEDDDDFDEEQLTKSQQEDLLRLIADTVGKIGMPGEQIRNVISVGMLSEGWDTKTVTQIMGLRAFTSQLLCEQVVGRGLRRTSYELDSETGLFEAEYVNIFGIPFTFLPHETAEGTHVTPPKPKTIILPLPEKIQHQINIPNVARVEHVYTPTLSLDFDKLSELRIDATEIRTRADLAPIIEGQPDISKLTTIQLDEIMKRNRPQRLIFEAAQQLYNQMKEEWGGNQFYLIAELIKIFEAFIEKGKVRIIPKDWNDDETKRRIALTLNLSKIINHIYRHIRKENTLSLTPIYNTERQIIYTGDMAPWYTSRPHSPTVKSHINYAVYDSGWETTEAYMLDRDPNVESWVKNEHLGFDIHYVHNGIHHKYRPDYIIRLINGTHLVLEVKGKVTQQVRSKELAMQEWIQAINQDGRFGKWHYAMSTNPKDLEGLIKNALNN